MSVVALARVVRDELLEELQVLEQGILQGVQDRDQYWALVGRRQGLKQALGILDDQAKRFDQQD